HGMKTLRTIASVGPRAQGVRPLPAGAGDVNGDNLRDVLGVTTGNQLRVMPGLGNGGTAAPVNLNSTIPAGARTFPIGDFNSDGAPDLGLIDAAGLLFLMPGNQAGGFGKPVQIGNGWNTLNLVFGGIDFDGD